MIQTAAALVVGRAWLDICIESIFWRGPDIRNYTSSGHLSGRDSWLDARWIGESSFGD